MYKSYSFHGFRYPLQQSLLVALHPVSRFGIFKEVLGDVQVPQHLPSRPFLSPSAIDYPGVPQGNMLGPAVIISSLK